MSKKYLCHGKISPEEINLEESENDERLKRIKSALLDQERIPRTIQELSDIVGIRWTTTRRLLRQAGICMMPKSWHTENALAQLYARRKNKKEIAEELGLSKYTISNSLTRLSHRSVFNLRKLREEADYEKILSAYQEGYKTRREIVEKTGLSYDSVCKYEKRLNLDLRAKRGAKRKTFPIRDRLIQEGLTLEQIAKEVKISRQGVNCYIRSSGQHEEWKQAGEKRKESIREQKRIGGGERQRKAILGGIVQSIIKQRGPEEYEDNQAFEQARKYSSQLSARAPLRDVYAVLINYKRLHAQFIETGEKSTLREIGEGTDLSLSVVKRILMRAGLTSISRVLEKHITPEWKKQAIRGLFDSEILREVRFPVSSGDVGYFLNVSDHVCWYTARQSGKRFPVGNTFQLHSQYKLEGFRSPLTCAKASQVYEAQDLGFSKQEIAELVGLTKEAIDYCNQHREEIEPEIICLINSLYQTKTDKPYLEKRVG